MIDTPRYSPEFISGAIAFRAKKDVCPYPPQSWEAKEWNDGARHAEYGLLEAQPMKAPR